MLSSAQFEYYAMVFMASFLSTINNNAFSPQVINSADNSFTKHLDTFISDDVVLTSDRAGADQAGSARRTQVHDLPAWGLPS